MKAATPTKTETAPMLFEAGALRQIFFSPYAQSSILAILDALDAGRRVSVRLGDGKTVAIKDAANMLAVLRDKLDWQPWKRRGSPKGS
jgi:hypothetical protein